jgi:hypothetical protein
MKKILCVTLSLASIVSIHAARHQRIQMTTTAETVSPEQQLEAELTVLRNDLIAIIEKLQKNKALQEKIYEQAAERFTVFRQELLERLKGDPAALKAKLEFFYDIAVSFIIKALQNKELRDKGIETVVETYTDATKAIENRVKSFSIAGEKQRVLGLVDLGLAQTATLLNK